MVAPLSIGERQIGPGFPCFVIAEAGVNHNGDLQKARELIKVAAAAGADAVKFQTFKADRLVTVDAPKADYQQQNTDPGESQLEMLRRLELSPEAHRELMALACEKRILFLSTPFDEQCADMLDEMGIAAFKLPSGEVTNLTFLEHVARKRKPTILSTGMSTLGEVELAVEAFVGAGHRNLALLHCVSSYPTDPEEANLRAMGTLSSAFGLPVGFSDHTQGIEVALAAVALGACIVEKHFTLDRSLPGPDHQASLEPADLDSLVRGIRKVQMSLGNGRKVISVTEANTAVAARKSLVAARDIEVGELLTEKLIAIKRPGTGLPPAMRSHLLGRRALGPIQAGTLLTLQMIS